MTREEAALVRLRLMAHRAFGAMVENRRGGSEEAQKDLDAIDWAIATIQSKIARPQPDPITGLVPCGCGGKAGFHYSVMQRDNDCCVACGTCGVHSRVALCEEEARDAWNRAMGWRVER